MILMINEVTGRVLGLMANPTNSPLFYQRSPNHITLDGTEVPYGFTEDTAHEYVYVPNLGLSLDKEYVTAAEVMALRNELLVDSDWRDLPSYPHADQVSWREYRQQLRDFPSTYIPTANPEWPIPPSG